MSRNRLGMLKDEAEGSLSKYTDLTKGYAFATYDRRCESSRSLSVEDIMMANLLDLGLRGRYVTPLFASGDGPPQALLAALRKADVDLSKKRAFETYERLDQLEEAVDSLAAAGVASESVPKWTAVAVSKVLHRRRPHIVPLIDSRVYGFYGTTSPTGVRGALWEDIRESADWLGDLAREFRTVDGDPLSLLRVADIIIWNR